MTSLVFPIRAAIQLTDKNLLPVKLEGVLFRVQLLARRNNDFTLQPFSSDLDGLVTISRKEMESEVAAHYGCGLTDYADVSECVPSVEIRLLSEDDIRRAPEARIAVCKNLLAGELDRWNIMEEFPDVYRNARDRILLCDQSPTIHDDWDEAEAKYSHNCIVVPR